MKDKLIILQGKVSKENDDSFWYDGEIAKLGKYILVAVGEIRIHNIEGDLVHDGYKERDDGVKGGLETDKDLEKIGNNYDDDYYWENNNWFEVISDEGGCELGNAVFSYDAGLEMLKLYHKEKV